MSRVSDRTLAREAVHTIQFLAVDAVERARSGHPGMPMGAADVAFVLWSRFLRYDPTAPDWPDRDRFVLSAGHGSMLLYSLLHLAGYDLPMAEIQAFRQWGSRTPGHPEFGLTPGVEATTGPLGQGVGNAVGMALAGKMMAARFNSEAHTLMAHRVFALASDGDMMEGVECEAASLAGHLRLGNLVVLYDDNRITIEGDTSLAFSEDVGLRHEACGWHVERVDGHDHEAIASAIDAAVAEAERPSLIVCRTHIAHGAPTKQDTAASHGAPLGAEEVRGAKERAGFAPEPAFRVPERVRALFRERAAEGAALRTAWEARFSAWRRSDPEGAERWDATCRRSLPEGFVDRLLAAAPRGSAATREHGNVCLQAVAAELPGVIGGSADLAPSTLAFVKGSPSVGPGAYGGRNLHFGIREHAMGAILNGIAYHGSFRPFGSTFFVFSDYMRPALRVAALAKLPVVYVFTHDSFFVGEDGPTHQPVEHLAALRAIPNLRVFRPADGFETALAWGLALERLDGPSAIVLSRQKLPPLPEADDAAISDARRGAWIVADAERPEAVVAATGSEVSLALAASEALEREGRRVRVVSVLSLDLFLEQDREHRERLLPVSLPVVTLEAGRTDPWRVLAGARGLVLGLDRFGASAPFAELSERLGFTPRAVAEKILDWLG